MHTYPAKSTFLFNHTYEKVIGGLGKVLIHYMEAGAPKENKVLHLNHSKQECGAFCPKIGLILVHTYPAKSTFLFNHTYEKVIGGLGKVLIHYYLWIESIIIQTHHYFGCNCSLPLFSRISHKKQSRTVLKIITVG